MRSERRCALVPEEAEQIAHRHFVLLPKSLGDQLSRRANQRKPGERHNCDPPWKFGAKKSEATPENPNGVTGDLLEQGCLANAPPYNDPYHGPSIDRTRMPNMIDALPLRETPYRRFNKKRKHSAFSRSNSWSFSTDQSEDIPHISEICTDDGTRLFPDQIFGEQGNSSVFTEPTLSNGLPIPCSIDSCRSSTSICAVSPRDTSAPYFWA